MTKKELKQQYKTSKKRFKNQLKFIKLGLSVNTVKTLKCAILRKKKKN